MKIIDKLTKKLFDENSFTKTEEIDIKHFMRLYAIYMVAKPEDREELKDSYEEDIPDNVIPFVLPPENHGEEPKW